VEPSRFERPSRFFKIRPTKSSFKESLLSYVRGCISSTIYPDMRWQGRLLFVFFLAMLFVPKNMLLTSTDYPEERSRLMKKMVAVIHLRLFSTIQESREAARLKT